MVGFKSTVNGSGLIPSSLLSFISRHTYNLYGLWEASVCDGSKALLGYHRALTFTHSFETDKRCVKRNRGEMSGYADLRTYNRLSNAYMSRSFTRNPTDTNTKVFGIPPLPLIPILVSPCSLLVFMRYEGQLQFSLVTKD
jgi:hypothetical protein